VLDPKARKTAPELIRHDLSRFVATGERQRPFKPTPPLRKAATSTVDDLMVADGDDGRAP
jgi:hypothetical protein